MTDKMGLHDMMWACVQGIQLGVTVTSAHSHVRQRNVAICNSTSILHFSLPEWCWQYSDVI